MCYFKVKLKPDELTGKPNSTFTMKTAKKNQIVFRVTKAQHVNSGKIVYYLGSNKQKETVLVGFQKNQQEICDAITTIINWGNFADCKDVWTNCKVEYSTEFKSTGELKVSEESFEFKYMLLEMPMDINDIIEFAAAFRYFASI